MKERRKDCKYCGKELTEGTTRKQFCCDLHRVYWHREQKEKGSLTSKIEFSKTTPESYDGKKLPKNYRADEPPQWVEPTKSDLLKAYEAELAQISPLANMRRSFLEKKIKELKKELK